MPLVPSCQLDFKLLTISLLGQEKKTLPKTSSFSLYIPSIKNTVLQFSIMECHADILPGVRVNNICCCVCLWMDQVISSWKTNQVDQLHFLLLNPSWLLPVTSCLSCASKYFTQEFTPKSYQKLRLDSPDCSSPDSPFCDSSGIFFLSE